MLSVLLSAVLAPVTIAIDPTKLGAKVSPDLYGIFFEEISCAGDGGLYSELVRNRSFEEGLAHWEVSDPSRVKVIEDGNGQNMLEITLGEPIRLINRGYWGMHFAPGNYEYSTRSRVEGEARCQAKFSMDNKVVGSWIWRPGTGGELTKATSGPRGFRGSGGFIELVIGGTGKLYIDDLSLTPVDESRGLKPFRPDLLNLLAGLKPAFFRFPGGCWVEGDTMATAYRWKSTIGQERAHVNNLWGYQSTNGIGYHEYLLLCERLKAAPMFVANCGMSHREVVPMDKMDEFVQDALDAIEYANGPVTSTWGAKRAAAGHPKPFNLKYLEIGNENGGPAYEERYALFYKAIKAKYPEVHLIADVWGGYPQKTKVDIIDEHYYSNPEFFLENANRYDRYDRKGPKVYVGEYAVTQGSGNGNLRGALAEAAFMMGMERNADHVIMASYAPLLANLNLKSWNPDLIYFDSSRSFGTPSYHVQKLFAENRPDVNVEVKVANAPVERKLFPLGGVGVGTWNTQAEFKEAKVESRSWSVTPPAGKLLLHTFESEAGTWAKQGYVLIQSSGLMPARAWYAAPSTSYTFSAKAKKISGIEGFLITVGRKDERNYVWLNLGGWGNTQHAIEWAVDGGKSMVGRPIPGKIETGRWYDISISYGADHITCWLDGKKIFDEKPKSVSPLYVAAGLHGKELVVKAVNAGTTPIAATIAVGKFKTVLSAQVLTSAKATDENSLAEPNRVAPRSIPMQTTDGQIRTSLPASSLTIVRLRR